MLKVSLLKMRRLFSIQISTGTAKDGTVTLNAHRGIYTIIIQSPGYEKYTNQIEVKGQIANILQYFKVS